MTSPTLAGNWERFAGGGKPQPGQIDGRVGQWFRTYRRGDELDDIYLSEEYLAATVMDTLVVMLTMDESDLLPDSDDDF